MIRRAIPQDAEQLSALAMKTFYDTFVDTCSKDDMNGFLEKYYNVEQTKLDLSGVDDFFYVYEIEQKMVGYIRFKECYDAFDELKNFKSLELKRLYVHKEYHGKGIAQSLMDFYIQFAKHKSYNLLYLGVWEHNERAKAFYQKNGFEATGHKHLFPIGNTPQTDIWLWQKI